MNTNVQQKQILLRLEIVISSLNENMCGGNCSYLTKDLVGYKDSINTEIICCKLLLNNKIRLFSNGTDTLRCKTCLDAEQLNNNFKEN